MTELEKNVHVPGDNTDFFSSLGSPESQMDAVRVSVQPRRLGDLQSMRMKFYFVGGLLLLYALTIVLTAQSTAEDGAERISQQAEQQQETVAPERLAQLKKITAQMLQIIGGVYVLTGLVLVGAAALLHRYPVVSTRTAFATYLVVTVLYYLLFPIQSWLDPVTSLVILFVLWTTVQTARAYQRDRALLAAQS